MTWSLSRLKTFETCHAKYDFRYNHKLEDTYKSPYAERGIAIHKDIENYLNRAGPAPEAASFLGPYLAEVLAKADVLVRPEFRLELARGWVPVTEGLEVWLVSILDLLTTVRAENKAVVDDWKSGKIYPDHDDQKELYAIGVFRLLPEINEVLTQFHYFDIGKVVARTFYRAHAEAAMERWNRRVAKMETATEFIPMPGYHCRYCSFSRARGGPCRF